MKLSDLVNYKNVIDNMSVLSLEKTLHMEISKITNVVDSQSIQIQDFAVSLENKQQQIRKSFLEFENELDALKHELAEQICTAEKPWLAESYRLYDQEMRNETLADIKFRSPELAPETAFFYQSRIMRYAGWKHTAMIVRPGFESFATHLVSCDPLYLVDVNHDFFQPCLDLFNEAYQQRLRTYMVNEREDEKILQRLPDAQFGLILAYNFFNYRPVEVVKQWLMEFYDKMRPGGMLLMTINDCDRAKGVMLVEQHFCCYTSGSMIQELARSIGFECEFVWHNNGPSTWIELQKPGAWSSIRGGQALAKILPKPVAESQ
jgi:SAM-dependent methyltransferase